MFPYAIEDFLFKTYGDWTTVEELNGVNEGKGTSCYRLFIGEKSFIVKKAKEKREYDVYNSLSGFLKIRKFLFPPPIILTKIGQIIGLLLKISHIYYLKKDGKVIQNK
ncbi:hypothetical protein MUB15_30725 [Priestia sp. OVS21]|nr:hypothetical protein [Priestia sp. OVS21]